MNEFFGYAESVDFRAKVSTLNDLASFARILDNNTLFINACNAYLSSPATSLESIKNRISTHLLSQNSAQEQFLHPYDVAMAAYLYLLYKIDPLEVHDVAHLIQARNLKNLWWSRHMLGIVGGFSDVVETNSQKLIIEPSQISASAVSNRVDITNTITRRISEVHNA